MTIKKKRGYRQKRQAIYLLIIFDKIIEKQYSYIPFTETFIKYDGKNYEPINEDELWFIILNAIKFSISK